MFLQTVFVCKEKNDKSLVRFQDKCFTMFHDSGIRSSLQKVVPRSNTWNKRCVRIKRASITAFVPKWHDLLLMTSLEWSPLDNLHTNIIISEEAQTGFIYFTEQAFISIDAQYDDK